MLPNGGGIMTSKGVLDEAFPQDKQIGGVITKTFTFNPMNLYQRMIFHSFKAT
jgi:hypothetical protein